MCLAVAVSQIAAMSIGVQIHAFYRKCKNTTPMYSLASHAIDVYPQLEDNRLETRHYSYQ